VNTDQSYRPRFKTGLLVGIYIAATLLTFLTGANDVDASVSTPTQTVQQADPPDAVGCKAQPVKRKYDNLIWTKLFPGSGYEVTIDYEVKYNGCTVSVIWRDCEVNWSLLWDVSEIKCKHWSNSTGTRLYIQTNYVACLVARGGPICASGWAKRTVGPFGERVKTEGSFIN
jgi:hypothetical protein